MAWWNFYFIAIAVLHFKGYLHAGFLWNFLLFMAVLVPVPAKWPGAERITRIRTIIAACLALVLLWSETWLPPVSAIWSFLSDPATRPSADYIWQFFINSLNPWLLGALALALAATRIAAKKKIRLTPLTFVMLGALAFTGSRGAAGGIERFYQTESKREVRLDRGAAKPDFDIILIHVCSLAWDDLAHSKFDARPFFSKFDYLFTNFNSATSYSNPAATRLLQAPCGQRSHAGIFSAAPRNCYLMEDLRERGYKTYTLINHDGKYDGYMEKIIKNAKADPMFQLRLEPEKLNFDDTPIYSDKEVLGAWLKAIKGQKGPAAVYYNTISMHGGSHYSKAKVKNPWELDRIARYNNFLKALTEQLESFFAELKASGRKAVVVFVPEHGAALQGTRLQGPDLRDIPFPQMTLVQLAFKIFGPGYNGRTVEQKSTDKPVSYLALAKTLSAMMDNSPYTDIGASQKAVLSDIPETQLVSENVNALVMRKDLGFTYRSSGGEWRDLPEDITPRFTGKRYMAEGPAAKE